MNSLNHVKKPAVLMGGQHKNSTALTIKSLVKSRSSVGKPIVCTGHGVRKKFHKTAELGVSRSKPIVSTGQGVRKKVHNPAVKEEIAGMGVSRKKPIVSTGAGV